MRPRKLALLITTLISFLGFGQAKLRKLPSTINHPAINVYSPYISLDGNSLVYISDNSDENQLTMFYTVKKDAVNWKEPVMLPKTVNNRLNFLGGFALSADGKTLYISSLKSGGLGGFDILVSPLKGTVWAEPVNLGLPINSREHEACPSFTPDESTLYFMRCGKMDQRSASDCRIFVSKKSRLGRWEEPIELPSYINTGNSQSPRIMGDGETLLFSSDQFANNKGGMDLYMTRLNGSEWSKPMPLDFANTPKDDQYVSAAALGRYLLKDQPGQRSSEIVEILFTDDVKPKAVVKMEGSVAGISNPGSPYVAVFNQKTQINIINSRPDKNGDFTFYLKEGARYDVSVEPETDEYTFYSKVYDFTGDRIPMFEQMNATLKPVTKGTEIELAIDFRPYTSQIAESSGQELRRLARLVKGNSNHKFSIDVTLAGYVSDSIKSSPDLTQVQIDTIHFTIEKQIPDTVKLDSLLMVMNKYDSVKNINPDSTSVSNDAYFKYQIDSIRLTAFKTIEVDSIGLKYTYHNDRTEMQANAILDYLIKAGGSAQNIKLTYNATPEAIAEKRKTIVKIKVVE